MPRVHIIARFFRNYTNIYLKGDTERREFFASGEEERTGNTVVFPSGLTKYDAKKAVANVLF